MTTTHSGGYSVHTFSEIESIPDRFYSLFFDAEKSSLFHSLAWYRNFAETVLAADEALRIFAVETSTQPPTPRALLILRYSTRGTKPMSSGKLSGASNYYTSLYGPLIDPNLEDLQEALDALAYAVSRDTIRWTVVDLHPLEIDSQIFQALMSAFGKAGFLVQRYFCFGNWYLDVKGRSFAEYLSGRTSRLSRTGRRLRRNLEKSNRFRFELVSAAEQVNRGFSDYDSVYRSSWKVPEPYPDFMIGLMRACAERGWLRLGLIYMDNEPAAAQFWIVVEGRASIYKMAYDERYAKDSVGSVLSSILMEHVVDVDKVTEVDYLTGDDAYKRDWMSHRRERWGLVAYDLKTPTGFVCAMRHLVGRAGRTVLKRLQRKK